MTRRTPKAGQGRSKARCVIANHHQVGLRLHACDSASWPATAPTVRWFRHAAPWSLAWKLSNPVTRRKHRHKGQRERYNVHLVFAVLMQARDMLLTAPEPGKHVRGR